MSRSPIVPDNNIVDSRNAAELAVLEFDHANQPNIAQQIGQSIMLKVADGVEAASDFITEAKVEIIYSAHSLLAGFEQRAERAMPNLHESFAEKHGYDAVPPKARFLGVVATRFMGKHAAPKAAKVQSKHDALLEQLENQQGGGRLANLARGYRRKLADKESEYLADRGIVWNDTVKSFWKEKQPRPVEGKEVDDGGGVWTELKEHRQTLIDSLVANDVAMFAKTIPASDNYADDAKQTMHHLIDGSDNPDQLTTLFNNKMMVDEVKLATGHHITEIKAELHNLLDGVATMLWKMDLIGFTSYKTLEDGEGEFNPSVERQEGKDFVRLSLPYNPVNELHKMLAPNAKTGSMINIEMPKQPSGNDPGMFMHVSAS